MRKLRELWQKSARMLFVVLTGILFYELLEHFGAVSGVFSSVTRVLRPIFAGLFIAYVVNIPSTLLQRTVFKKTKGKLPIIISNIAAYLLVAGLIALVVLLVLPKAAEGVRMLLGNIENYYNSVVEFATDFWNKLNLSDEATQKAVEVSRSLAQRVETFALNAIPKLLNYTFSTVGFMTNAFLAVTFSIYCLAGKNKLLAHARRFIRAVLKESSSEKLLDFCSFSNATFRGYISGQLISSAALGILCYIGMRIFGMPYPEMISVIIAAFALIPILGSYISTVAGALIILMAAPDKPMLALWFIVMIFIIQQVDNNFINPNIVGNAVGLSTAWVLLGIIVGGGLFGVTGLLFAVPVTAVLYRLVADWTNERAKARGVPIVETVPHTEYDKKHKKPASQPKRRPFFKKAGSNDQAAGGTPNKQQEKRREPAPHEQPAGTEGDDDGK